MVFIASTVILSLGPVLAEATNENVINPTVTEIAASAGVTSGALITSGTFIASNVSSGIPVMSLLSAAGLLGWFIVGTKVIEPITVTFDCWKNVTRETSKVPSKGITLNELLASPLVTNYDDTNFTLSNTWGEKFQLSIVNVPENVLNDCFGTYLHVEKI